MVLDTNVLISALISRNREAAPAQLLDAALRGSMHLLVSTDVLAEYRGVLLRERHMRRHHLSVAQVGALIAGIVEVATSVDVTSALVEGPDPKDAHLWRVLRAEPSATLVTGEKRLIRHAPTGTRAVTPRAWLDAMLAGKTETGEPQP